MSVLLNVMVLNIVNIAQVQHERDGERERETKRR